MGTFRSEVTRLVREYTPDGPPADRLAHTTVGGSGRSATGSINHTWWWVAGPYRLG